MKRTLVLGFVAVVLAGFLVLVHGEGDNVVCPETQAKEAISVNVEGYFTSFEQYTDQDSVILLFAGKVIVCGDADWLLSVEVVGELGDYHASHFLRVVFLSDSWTDLGSSIVGHGSKEVWLNYHLRDLKCLPPSPYDIIVKYTITPQ